MAVNERISKEIFEYKADFDPNPTRVILGLDGHKAIDLPLPERNRLASLLFRGGYLSSEDIEFLGGRVEIIPEHIKGECPTHGDWYFESGGFNCAHEDHVGGLRYIDRTPGLRKKDT